MKNVLVLCLFFTVCVCELSGKQQYFVKLMKRCVAGFDDDSEHISMCTDTIGRFLSYNYTIDTIRPFKNMFNLLIDLHRRVTSTKVKCDCPNVQKMIRKSHIVPIVWTLLILVIYNFFFGRFRRR